MEILAAFYLTQGELLSCSLLRVYPKLTLADLAGAALCQLHCPSSQRLKAQKVARLLQQWQVEAQELQGLPLQGWPGEGLHFLSFQAVQLPWEEEAGEAVAVRTFELAVLLELEELWWSFDQDFHSVLSRAAELVKVVQAVLQNLMPSALHSCFLLAYDLYCCPAKLQRIKILV